jgi:hypothetical protein
MAKFESISKELKKDSYQPLPRIYRVNLVYNLEDKLNKEK